MSDTGYRTFPNTFVSKGIIARTTDDTLPSGTYLNLDNCEEQTENAMCSRLGSIIVNRTGTTIDTLTGSVHSLYRLVGLNGNNWRYAGASNLLYRRTGTTQGSYTLIYGGFFVTPMSGKQWSAVTYRPNLSSYPYAFIADANVMLKDNGTLTTPQQWGIFQPTQPVQAVLQPPQWISLDNGFIAGGLSTLVFVNFNLAAYVNPVSTTLGTATAAGSIQTVTPASMNNIVAGQFLSIGGITETVYVLSTTNTTFTAHFVFAHIPSDSVTWTALQGQVNTSTTATITYPNPGFATMPNLGNFASGLKTQPDDYINLNMFVDNPNDVQQINVMFDVGDGTFSQDYYIKTLQPSIDQPYISGTETAEQAAVNQVFADALGLTTAGDSSPYYLNTGDSTFNFVRVKLGDFNTVGKADPTSPQFGWANVNSFRIEIITNTNGPVTVSFNNFFLSGGSGLDSTGGVGYDWLYTYYNINTGAESNPCIPMSSVLPTTGTQYYIARYPTPVRQPVNLQLLGSTDPQVTHVRIYRRGGSLSTNYYRVNQVANISGVNFFYEDIAADSSILGGDAVSFVNDVPVTSTLPVPVNTTLTAGLTPTYPGSTMVITPASMANISLNQQVTLGSISDPSREIVIVQSKTATTFTAFVQNPHFMGDPVTAEAIYGQPCNLAAIAFNKVWLAGDPNNPHYLYFSTAFSPEAFGSASYIEVGVPSDPITAIVPFQGALYVATRDHWYIIGPNTGSRPTVYPTTAVHGVYAPHGWVATETEIWHVSVDGIRTFAGASSNYRSQEIEFLFQGGTTPIVPVDPNNLAKATMAYRDNMVFMSYLGTDAAYHRLIYHCIYRRWRNDDINAVSMYVEEDTNLLIWGEVTGLVHQDRIGTYDEASNGATLIIDPINLNLQTAFMDQGQPKNQKQYNELTLDANTGGQTLNISLLFDDGQTSLSIGTINTTSRQKVNFNLNNGLGQQAYRASLQLTGAASQLVTLYQADLRGIELAETRQSFDTYWLRFGTTDSKLCRRFYLDYNSSQSLNVSIFYDGSPTAFFTATMQAAPNRTSTWVHLPAIKFRLMRMTITSTADFQVWDTSKFEIKPICATKGYETVMMFT